MYDEGDLAGTHVLVIEDDWVVAIEVRRMLERAGAVVIGPLGTVETALLAITHGEPVDVVVLDINLQGMMAYPIADLLMERGVKFAFVTGYSREGLPPGYENVPLYEKPTDPCEVVRHLISPATDQPPGVVLDEV